MPFFKQGTHERLFASLAAGAVPLTPANLWIDKNFKKNKELLSFELPHFEEVDPLIQKVLQDETLRSAIALAGQKKRCNAIRGIKGPKTYSICR